MVWGTFLSTSKYGQFFLDCIVIWSIYSLLQECRPHSVPVSIVMATREINRAKKCNTVPVWQRGVGGQKLHEQCPHTRSALLKGAPIFLVEVIFVLHISRQSKTNNVQRAGSWTRSIYFGMFECFKMDSIWERILCIHQNIRILERISFLFRRSDPNLSVGVLIETDGYPSSLAPILAFSSWEGQPWESECRSRCWW